MVVASRLDEIEGVLDSVGTSSYIVTVAMPDRMIEAVDFVVKITGMFSTRSDFFRVATAIYLKLLGVIQSIDECGLKSRTRGTSCDDAIRKCIATCNEIASGVVDGPILPENAISGSMRVLTVSLHDCIVKLLERAIGANIYRSRSELIRAAIMSFMRDTGFISILTRISYIPVTSTGHRPAKKLVPFDMRTARFKKDDDALADLRAIIAKHAGQPKPLE
jgi:metal-responsive CopG/Arc/MetJ family transcriptional regulator